MALIGNYSVLNKTPGRWLGGTSTAHASGVGSAQVGTRANWNSSGASRNFAMMDGDAHKEYHGIPSGYLGKSWVLPTKAGYISAVYNSQGVATATASIKDGRNIAGTSDGVATVTGTAQLVVSGAGSAAGVATVTGNINAALAAAGTSAGVATASGTINALAWAVGSSSGVATASLVSYATGSLSGSIAPAITLEASAFSSYLLDEEDVETGLTMRKALRLIAAATAGKVSGAAGTTVTIRNAVADGKDRIVATVDAQGNRSAITYDLDD